MSTVSQGAKVYLIHTTQHNRPFLTTVPFIARDFAAWGHRVDHHPAESAYITEIRSREDVEHANRKDRGGSRRTKLMEIWATEAVRRKRRQRGGPRGIEIEMSMANGGFGPQDARVKKAGDLVQDVIDGVASFEARYTATPIRQNTSPGSPPTIVTTYTRHLFAIRYTPNAPLPSWSNPDITYADQVVLEFHDYEEIRREDLVHAINSAIGKNEGRMGKVERCPRTGMKRVILWVDVADVFFGDVVQDERNVEDRDPVPKYERGERPPVYAEER
ncbi:hypothetical protein J4E93_009761 [Alternaria ventricosa]|uniref:uncharacterized protein n=1 Tax=Alternaria ventricosa TaxID=1187951 RepID=UPI0020C27850|nr:uncharacterized protein J4E93_009761 [Alternaria ventricosa]KAI4638733.1 hypothetical protein J4E93_009761 [Alternaria ventricosa]